jgi:HEAT repeat protein
MMERNNPNNTNKIKFVLLFLAILSLCSGCIEEPSVEHLIQDLDDMDANVRTVAEEGLVEIGEPAVESLIQILSNENEATIARMGAARTLGRIGDERAVEPLIQLLNEHHYWELQNASAVALGNIGDAKAVEPLISVLQDGYANEQTIEYGTDRTASIISGGRVQAMCSAAESLGKIGDERAVEQLIIVLQKEDEYRQAQTLEFGAGGKITMTSGDRIQLTCNAAEALGKIGDKRAIEPLKQLQNDGNEDIKMAATNALKNISHHGSRDSTITDSRQLKINASEIGEWWEEENYYYMSDPVGFFKDFVNQIDESAQNPEGAKEDKERLLEIANELKESDVKDGSVLQLRKAGAETTISYVELDTFVFNKVDGAKTYFDYRDQKSNGTRVSGIGDEATVIPDKYGSHHGYLVRISNAFLEITVYGGEEEEARAVSEKVVEIFKVKC